jgi:transcriptional regulator with XRE-family HTH domain
MAEEISFADWLTEQLHYKHMTQKDLADKAGLGKSTINKLVNRKIMRPDPRTYVAIAKALDISPITVFRIAGILPPDVELPELEDYKVVISGLSPEARITGLELLRALARRE